MAEISAGNVAKLREMTGVGMMDCKKALTEANGDLQTAVEILRKKGQAGAANKSLKEAREGLIVAYVAPGGKLGVLAEINCQTDFVARNDDFKAFAEEVAKAYAANANADLEARRTEMVAKIGENIRLARHQRLEVTGAGQVAAYIHTGAKVGVLVEVGCTKDDTTTKDEFKQLVKDITLQIAAAHPVAVSREEVDPKLVEKEREIAAEQFKNKPPQAIAKIVEGKLNSFFQTICLVDQGFVKDPEKTVSTYVAEVGKKLGDEIKIRRFLRFQVGEAVAS
ncbi:MAG TPA: translation elongation factor Ts [Verrucomicrobiae bacterium]|nr:translation elongation factor Ts [Verrucomicrobiae bacterium]